MRIMIILMGLLIVSQSAVFSQRTTSQQRGSCASIFQRSCESNSLSEKIHLRRKIMEEWPATPEGICSKAWIMEYLEDTSVALSLYRQCIHDYPNLLYTKYIFPGGDANEQAKYLREVVKAEPTFNDGKAILLLWKLLFNELNDIRAADSLLRFCRKVYPDWYMTDYIAVLRLKADNPDSAVVHLQRAYRNPGAGGEVYEMMFNAMYGDFIRSHQESSDSARLAFMGQILSPFSAAHPRDNWSALFAAGEAKKYLRAEYGYGLLKEAFDIRPQAEICRMVMNTLNEIYVLDDRMTKDAYDFLKRARDSLPDNYLAVTMLARFTADKLGDSSGARKLYQQAEQLCPTLKDSLFVLEDMESYYYRTLTFNYPEIIQKYSDYDQRYRQGGFRFDADIQLEIANLNLLRKDYGLAKIGFESSRRYNEVTKDLSPKYYVDALRYIDESLKNQKEEIDYLTSTPFITQWEKKFGTSLTLNIPFNEDSSTINKAAVQKLDTLTSVMQSPGSDEYIFAVDGFCNGVENNVSLSKQRADNIADYLHHRPGIPYSRLQTEGYGANSPIADNATRSGRQRNRRVDIYPVANINDQAVVVNSYFDTRLMAISPNGRYAAVNYQPLEIWDITKKARLKEFNTAIERVFSPNSRYLATVENVANEGGFRAYNLIIYDIRTGLTAVKIPFAGRVRSLCWNPSGSKLAFIFDLRHLVIYDFLLRKVILSKIVSTDAIESMLWTRDGKYIVTGERGTSNVKVWTPSNLKLYKDLSGLVGWTHCVGQTYDSKYIMVADDASKLVIWDTQKWEHRTMYDIGAFTLGGQIVPHPFQHKVLISDNGHGDSSIAILVDIDSMKIQRKILVGYEQARFAYSNDAKVVYESNDGRIDILDANKLVKINEIAGVSNEATGVLADTTYNYLVTFDTQNANVWDITRPKKVHSWPDHVYQFRAMDSSRFIGVYSVPSERRSGVRLYDLKTFQKSEYLRLEGELISNYCINDSLLIVATVPYTNTDQDYIQSNWLKIHVYNMRRRIERLKFSIPVATEGTWDSAAFHPGVQSMCVDNASSKIAIVTTWQKSYKTSQLVSGVIQFYSPDSSYLGPITVDGPEKMSFDSGSSNIMTLSFSRFSLRADIRLGKVIDKSETGINRIDYPLMDSTVRLWSGYQYVSLARKGSEKTIYIPDLVGLGIFESANLCTILRRNSVIEFYSFADLSKLLSLVSERKDQWIAYRSDGVFVSSLNGSKNSYLLMGGNVVNINHLGDSLRDGKKINQILEDNGNKVSVQSNDSISPRFRQEYFASPYVVNVRPGTSITKWYDSVITLRVEIKRKLADAPDPVLLFTVNSDTVLEPYKIETINKDSFLITQHVRVRQGPNAIGISGIINRFGFPLVNDVRIQAKLTPEGLPVARQSKTKIWYFGVGLSRYKDSNLNLQYADKDICELDTVLQQMKGKVCDTVISLTLTNDAARHERVWTELTSFLNRIDSNSNDLIIVALGGHGGSQTGAFLRTFDSDPDEGNNVPIKLLRDKIARYGRCILLLDMCRGQETKSGFTWLDIKNMPSNQHPWIFTSSSGNSYSYEDSSFCNGESAFTCALIRSLRERPHTIQELYYAVVKKVRDLMEQYRKGETQEPELMPNEGNMDLIEFKLH